MVFPNESFTARGGCQCKAVRYRVSVPAFQERASAPGLLPGMKSAEDVRLPMSTVCHCNSCRGATGQLAAFGIAFEKAHVELSIVTRAGAESGLPLDGDRHWASAVALLDDQEQLEKLSVSLYDSSSRRRKIFAPEWGWPDAMAIMTPTIDREFLSKDWWKPERATWTACGIPWVRDLARGGLSGLIEHPLAFRDKFIGDDIGAELELFKTLGESVDITISQ
ncbi:hypothetical protein ACCO45_000404 [Purpureocillium lilacinum]|uniref:Uncharacterized protein n=1 Tax=Purpureocillium lilacinum TaxID=33203 RepID=A0ACC4E439_PURLI